MEELNVSIFVEDNTYIIECVLVMYGAWPPYNVYNR